MSDGITLTEINLKNQYVRDLLSRIMGILGNGGVRDEDVVDLKRWFDENREHCPDDINSLGRLYTMVKTEVEFPGQFVGCSPSKIQEVAFGMIPNRMRDSSLGMEAAVRPRGREKVDVALTEEDLDSEDGRLLLNRLISFSEAPCREDNDVIELSNWLKSVNIKRPMAAYEHVCEYVHGAVSSYGPYCHWDKKIKADEAVLKVLPKNIRDRIIKKHKEVEKAELEKEREEDPATAEQIARIKKLGGKVDSSLSDEEAEDLIQDLCDEKGIWNAYGYGAAPTPRQEMVLRFWNKMEMMNRGANEVSPWIDDWYSSDPDRLEAWELWKKENNDSGERWGIDVTRVKIGAGSEYLQRVKRRDESLNTSQGCLGVILCGGVLVVAGSSLTCLFT